MAVGLLMALLASSVAQAVSRQEVGDDPEAGFRRALRIGVVSVVERDVRAPLLVKRHYVSLEFGFFSTRMKLLQERDSAKELELVDDQSLRLEPLLSKAEADLDRFRMAWLRADSGQKEKLARECESLKEEYDRRVREILLPHQTRTMDLMVQRYQLSALGLGYWMDFPGVADSLELDQREQDAARRSAGEYLPQFRQDTRKLAVALWQSWMGVLDERQVQSVEGLLKTHAGMAPTEQYELLLWQSNPAACEDLADQRSEKRALWEIAGVMKKMRLTHLGGLSGQGVSSPGMPGEDFAFELLSSPLAEELGIPSGEIPDIQRRWYEAVQVESQQFGDAIAQLAARAPANGPPGEALLRERDELAAAFADRIRELALGMLPAGGKDRLDQLVARAAVARLGLLHAKRLTELTQFLELRQDQIARIKEISEQHYHRIRDAGLKMEYRFFDSVVKAFDTESANRFKSLIDVRSPVFQPVPMLILQASEGEPPSRLGWK